MAASMDGAIKKYIDDFDDSAFNQICQGKAVSPRFC